MNDKQQFSYRTEIGAFEFTMKMLAILPRIPSVAYNAITGLKMVKGNKNISWASVLEDIARKYPGNPAIKSPDGTLTYAEMNAKANRYAHFLLSKTVGKGDVVAVCLENGRSSSSSTAPAPRSGHSAP